MPAAGGVTDLVSPPTKKLPCASSVSTADRATGAAIKLAVNPWTGSAVNANVAKVVLESKLGTKVEFTPVSDYAASVEALANKQIDLA